MHWGVFDRSQLALYSIWWNLEPGQYLANPVRHYETDTTKIKYVLMQISLRKTLLRKLSKKLKPLIL